jgi:hypothetical protein
MKFRYTKLKGRPKSKIILTQLEYKRLEKYGIVKIKGYLLYTTEYEKEYCIKQHKNLLK